MEPVEGIRKAALLLMGLEPSTAAELLKSAEPETVTQIAAELAYLQASGATATQASEEPVREFFDQLREQQSRGLRGQKFLRVMLDGAVGAGRSAEIMERIADLVDQRDPFLPIRSAEPEDLAEILAGESPQVAGVVLAELPPKVSAKLLPLLNEAVRAEAVRGMTREEGPGIDTRMRVAGLVRRKLTDRQATGGSGRARRQEQLRRVALLLRGLGSDLRGALLDAIGGSDKDTSTQIQELMVVWDDIPIVSDRSLQEALRAVDSQKLALALVDANDKAVEKLRLNMSQRQLALLDEEASLLSQPGETEIEEARGELLQALRELASSNFLTFDEDE